MSRFSTLSALLAPLVAAALLVTVPPSPDRDRPSASAATQEVNRTMVACPGAPRRGAAVRLTYGLAATGPAGGAAATLSVSGVGEPLREAEARRGATVMADVAPAGGLVVVGTEEHARGLFAGRTELVTSSSGGALATTACPQPGAEWWFPGAGAGIDHSSELFLSNVDDGPAVVDVRVHAATGSVDVAGTRGITLAPGESARLPLVDVAPGSSELTVEVDATRGRVVAAVADEVRGREGVGVEWLPAATPPGGDVRLAGVPARADRRTLLVTNPGEEQAVVSVQVLSEGGAFVPLGKEEISVDPDAIAALDLTEELGNGVAAIRLRSDVDVIGTLRSSRGYDHAYAAPVDDLTGPTLVTDVGDRTFVQLSGGEEPAGVTVAAFTGSGRRIVARSIRVAPSGTVTWPLPAAAAYAVVTPRSGSAAGAVVHQGPGTSVAPGWTLPVAVSRPVVRPLGHSAS